MAHRGRKPGIGRSAIRISNLLTALASAGIGYARGVVGRRFDWFGRRLGLKLVLRGMREGRPYVVAPVSCVRYWEFDFVDRALPAGARSVLDVSSPRLFAFYALSKRPELRVLVTNPDPSDARVTRTIAQAIGQSRLQVSSVALEALRLDSETLPGTLLFDTIWTISVLEHVEGAYDERVALRWLWDRLLPGGRLILTVPVDRKSWVEYREADPYGTQLAPATADGRYFFQRWYDEGSIEDRLVKSIGVRPSVCEYYGERVAGHFHEYTRRWLVEGPAITLRDPAMMAAHYQVFPRWAEMPGCGVAGLAFDKAR